MGYFICTKCKSYYKLRNGESQHDFVNKCVCGRELRYVKNIDIVEPNWKQCTIEKYNKTTKKEIKTVVDFEIPFPIYVDNQPFEFEINGIKHILSAEIFKNPSGMVESFGGGQIELLEDKYGMINKTKVNMTIFNYIDPNDKVEIKIYSQKTKISKIIFEAVNALNYFINHYRIISGNYWIENVSTKMIKKFSFIITEGKKVLHESILNIDHIIKYSSEGFSLLNDKEISDLSYNLNKYEIPLWNILLLDAKDFLLRRNFREAIFAINGAFENFLNIQARKKLIKYWDRSSVDDYLNGIPIYEYHDLKDYLDEKKFYEAVKNNKIRPHVPTVYRIIKQCYKLESSKISLKELNGLVNKIRKNRNEIMHGTQQSEDLEKIVYEAIESFQIFIDSF